MIFTTVQECPSTEETWQQRAKKCTRSDHYHCLLNENSVVVEGCINPIWVEPGNCPVYISKASKLDAQTCQMQVCPNEFYLSKNIFKYNACFTPKRTSEIPVSLNVDEPTQQRNTTLPIPSQPSLPSSITAVVIPIILIIVLLSVIAAAIILYKRKRGRDNETKNPRQKTENEANLEQNEILLNEDCPSPKDSIQNDGTESFTREELLTHMNINIEEITENESHVSDFATVLLENKSLALIGEWGSGKRTLSAQIALKMEKMVNHKLKFKVIHHFDEMCESIISGLSQPTIFILPDLYKFWCTDHHIEDVKNFLIFIRSITKDKKMYIIGTFTENAWTSFTSYFPNWNIDSLFPRRTGFNLSANILSEIAGKNKNPLIETEINEITCVRSVLGKPLITILYCKNIAYRNAHFLKNPLMFILSDLKGMRDSLDLEDRVKFRVLVYIMFRGGKVDAEKLEKVGNQPLFEEINIVKDKGDYIKGCVRHLLNGYMEKTSTGKSYRMLHDVITKCVFLVAAEKEPELMFKECDFLLLLDCIRLKSHKEKFLGRGKLIFDYNALNIGIPTELFLMVARIFKQRNENMAMLRKVKLFSDEDFQSVWKNI